MSIPLYYKYHTRRSKKPAGWRVIRIRSALADRPGKYLHFTGFISWGPCEATVHDCDFILYRGFDHHVVMMMPDRGQWSGYLPTLEDPGREWFDNDDNVAALFKVI